MPLTDTDMNLALRKVTFLPGWKVMVRRPPGQAAGGLYLQWRFTAPDLETGEDVAQAGRKWYLSPHMTVSELVTTALKAALTAVEHEAREAFRYKGACIFGPHLDVNALAEFAKDKDNIDMRTGQWVQPVGVVSEGSA